MIIGGSALPEALAEEAASIGIEAVAGYGMSETGPIIAIARSAPGDATVSRCRAGIPIPLVDVAVDPERGNELTLRAPWLTQGYATQAASDELWEGGRLHTGDIAALDPDGGIRIVDRLKDVIKTGGEWVSSLEIEELLMSHPGIAEAAVIGVSSERWGERPIAFVVLAPGVHDVTAEAIRAEVVRHIEHGTVSRYAVPDDIHFTDALPETSVGKVDKKQLRLDNRGLEL